MIAAAEARTEVHSDSLHKEYNICGSFELQQQLAFDAVPLKPRDPHLSPI